ncbi:RHS repeat-associated core domain-containing protein, partial [Treponema pedis]|uniref:RHS repeat-associated core domain-containing protein n=1 Tax=Treponema pedis TaxID=409322 RepID=UPI001CEFA389
MLFRYQGQYLDSETDLYYNRFRYYDPNTGTYISQDPIGLNSRVYNLYFYVSYSNLIIAPFRLEKK